MLGASGELFVWILWICNLSKGGEQDFKTSRLSRYETIWIFDHEYVYFAKKSCKEDGACNLSPFLSPRIQIITNLHQVWKTFAFWQEKSRKLIWICALTGKIWINLRFDRKYPDNWFEFVFSQVKSYKPIWICVKGPFKESYWRNIDQNWVINSFRVNLFWNLKKTKILFLWKKILFLSIMILLPDFYQLARLADQNHSFFYKTLLE